MAASAPSSSNPYGDPARGPVASCAARLGRGRSWIPALLAVLAGGCVEELDPIAGTTSLEVTLIAPTETGSVDDRLEDDQRSVTIQVRALDAQGEVDTGLDASVDLFIHFLGGLSPDLADEPFASIDLTAGASAEVALDLPAVFGPTFLWAEHASGDDATFATGTSPVIWYRDPFLEDVSRPPDEMALDAMERSPLESKQINVNASRHGEDGRMVVTATYAQGYTLSDVQCGPGGAPPCTTGPYDSVLVFTFSRPRGEEGESIDQGDTVARLTGAIGEFNGLTEVNFPQSFMTGEERDQDRIPDPVVIQEDWLQANTIEMERVESALVAVEGAPLCELDEAYDTFKQWKLAVGGDCANRDGVVNIITQGQVNEFDPTAYEAGSVFPRVVGTLRPVNIGSFHVWIIYPRAMSDVTPPEPGPP